MNTVPQRRTMTLVLLFALASVALILLDNRQALAPLRTMLDDLVTPASGLFGRVTDGPEEMTTIERTLAETEAERDRLRKENAELKAYRDEVEALRAQQKVQEDYPEYVLIQARVSARDPSGSELFVVINKGTADGVAKDMAVVNPNSYVGQITEVSEHQARVMLITDNSMRVGAKLVDAQADGVVYGQWQSGKRLEMRHVDPEAKVALKEVVVTSDQVVSQTRGVPPNIPIGYVGKEPTVDPRSDQLVVEVYPYTNFADLELVWVMAPDG